MTLAWRLDKIGPMCRSVEECAVVLNAIQGPDDRDFSVLDIPFNWDANLDIRKLRVGYLKGAFSNTRQTPQVEANDAAALAKLRGMGIELVEIALPEHADLDIGTIIYGEGHAALKDPIWTRPGDLGGQEPVCKQHALRLLPAAEYLNANRIRTPLMEEVARVMSGI